MASRAAETGRDPEPRRDGCPVCVRLRRRVAELEADCAAIRSRLHRDPLTHLVNREYVNEELERALSFAGRNRLPLAVVICDLDRFKRINDRYGHAGGDAVLSAFGELLGGSCRREDTVARYGGDEFLVLLPNTPIGGAVDFAERVRTRTEGLRTRTGAAVTASFGVAAMEAGDTAASLRERADAALYRAKRHGRNRVARAPVTRDAPDPTTSAESVRSGTG